jgi:HEXXH motif-containing protein
VTLQVPGLARRLARALRIVRIAWPEAHREVLLRTRMVVPIHEPGTVSWSLAARPGISFIHVSGKSLLDLADDLLHENSHHRLHDMEEAARLLRPGADTEEVQAFDSPWRGTRRPLRGILHGAFTFLFRAGLLRGILSACRDHPRLLAADLGRSGLPFVRRELRREIGMIGRALKDLKHAAAQGLLTPAGGRLVRRMSSDYREVRRG